MNNPKKKIYGTLAVILLILFGIFAFFYWGKYSEGSRAGMVVKISNTGTLFKTYEGQLNMQTFGATADASGFSQVWNFSVEGGEEQVVQSLRDASLSGERVELYYIERYWKAPWRGETKYFIRDVRRTAK